MQVEPMVHRECAILCIDNCPSLKRDVANGTLAVRQVFRFEVQLAIMGPQYVQHYVPDYVPNPSDRIIGHAKVVLLKWRDRDEAWLRR